ncbi:hypothetical protein MK079_01495 [Candidatus Gracilibacteria bacterium]|nr:hypothetical protein [Candidatus Gracilibacteria bacterium]
MPNLKAWQKKIQDKRKQTDLRDFLMQIASWKPYSFYRYDGHVSRYPQTERTPKLCTQAEFNQYRDAPIALEYDPSLSFFSQIGALFQKVPFAYLLEFYNGNENADYCDASFGVKNGYLSTTVGLAAENIFYSSFSYTHIADIYNSFFVTDNTSQVYFSSAVGTRSYKVFYSRCITGSNNIWFSSNLIGCSECILCDGLQNQKYCIENKSYEKQAYFQKKGEILRNKTEFLKYYTQVNKTAPNYLSENCTGNALYFCENLENGYFFVRGKNGKNVMIGDGDNGCEHLYDCFDVGVNSEHLYGCVGVGDQLSHTYNSGEIGKGGNIYYSYYMSHCSHCIGCIGLKNKSYCILNKQYSKQEWYELADKIFSSMESDGTLGDFFPGDLNPFYFNDTMAGLLGDFTKEEVEAKGYMWRDEEIKVDIPEGSKIIQTTELDSYQGYDENGEWKIDPEILKTVIQDEKGNYYRIVQMEYDFLMKHALPLPEIHWMDRMKLNFGV